MGISKGANLMNPIQIEFIMPKFNFLRPFGKSKKCKRKAMRKILLIVNDLFKTDEKELLK